MLSLVSKPNSLCVPCLVRVWEKGRTLFIVIPLQSRRSIPEPNSKGSDKGFGVEPRGHR